MFLQGKDFKNFRADTQEFRNFGRLNTAACDFKMKA